MTTDPNESVADYIVREVAELSEVVEVPVVDFERLIMELAVKVDRQTETNEKLIELISALQAEVQPFIARLENNPMIRMMIGGGE